MCDNKSQCDTDQIGCHFTCNYIVLFPVDLQMAASRDSNERIPLIQDDHKERQQADSIIEAGCQSSPVRSRTTSYFAVLCILFVELCERLTFYSLTANIVFYCQNVLKLARPLPSTINLAFQGKFLSHKNEVQLGLITGYFAQRTS